MTSKSTADYLHDLLHELADITAFTVEGEEAFLQDVKTQKAVIRSYEVIGEIAKRLPDELRQTNPQIDWRRLITFRDFIAHNYDKVVARLLWESVQDVPSLRTAIDLILQNLQTPKV